MNKLILKSIIALLLVTFTISCSSDDDSGSVIPQPDMVANTWQLNDFKYTRALSVQQSADYGVGQPFNQVNIDSNISTENGNFKTCNLICFFNTNETGNYSIKSQNTSILNVTSKFIYIKCIITDASANGAVYESIDTNVTATVSIENGKYVISCPQTIMLTRTFNDGLANAPESFTFKCNEVR